MGDLGLRRERSEKIRVEIEAAGRVKGWEKPFFIFFSLATTIRVEVWTVMPYVHTETLLYSPRAFFGGDMRGVWDSILSLCTLCYEQSTLYFSVPVSRN